MAAPISPQLQAAGETPTKQTYASHLHPKTNIEPIIKTKLKQIEFLHGQPLLKFTTDELDDFSREEGLHQAVIMKFSYGKPDLNVLRKIIPQQLGIKGNCLIGHLEYRHLLIRFDSSEDFVKVLSILFGYLQVQSDEYMFRVFPWSQSFNPKEETTKALTWISFPNLPTNLFAKRSLLSIASAVGRPIAIDKATQDRTRPSTARVKVILDLLDEHPKGIRLQFVNPKSGKISEHFQEFVYDNLPKYCTMCKHQGHNSDVCRLNNRVVNEDDIPGEKFKGDLRIKLNEKSIANNGASATRLEAVGIASECASPGTEKLDSGALGKRNSSPTQQHVVANSLEEDVGNYAQQNSKKLAASTVSDQTQLVSGNEQVEHDFSVTNTRGKKKKNDDVQATEALHIVQENDDSGSDKSIKNVGEMVSRKSALKATVQQQQWQTGPYLTSPTESVTMIEDGHQLEMAIAHHQQHSQRQVRLEEQPEMSDIREKQQLNSLPNEEFNVLTTSHASKALIQQHQRRPAFASGENEVETGEIMERQQCPGFVMASSAQRGTKGDKMQVDNSVTNNGSIVATKSSISRPKHNSGQRRIDSPTSPSRNGLEVLGVSHDHEHQIVSGTAVLMNQPCYDIPSQTVEESAANDTVQPSLRIHDTGIDILNQHVRHVDRKYNTTPKPMQQNILVPVGAQSVNSNKKQHRKVKTPTGKGAASTSQSSTANLNPRWADMTADNEEETNAIDKEVGTEENNVGVVEVVPSPNAQAAAIEAPTFVISQCASSLYFPPGYDIIADEYWSRRRQEDRQRAAQQAVQLDMEKPKRQEISPMEPTRRQPTRSRSNVGSLK